MAGLPRPPWARRIDRCPNCIQRVPDERAIVCDRCGFQLRTPRLATVGLVLIAASLASLFLSAFGGFLFPWPRLPFLDAMSPEDLEALLLYLGSVLMLAGIAVAFAGAYLARRLSERALRGGTPP